MTDVAPNPLGQASIHDAVRATLAAAQIPDHHGFAAVVDMRTGAHAGVATRIGSSDWLFDVDGGYDWAGDHQGLNGRFAISRTWR